MTGSNFEVEGDISPEAWWGEDLANTLNVSGMGLGLARFLYAVELP